MPLIHAKRASLYLGILIALTITITGCGYSLVGTGSALPPHVKSIAIPLFTNSSSEPLIHRELTDAVRQAFINDNRLKVASKKRGSLLLTGNLKSYELKPVAFTGRDVAQEYWVLLGVDVKVYDQAKKKIYLEENYQTKWNYIAPQDVTNAEEARQEALREAYRDFANRVLSQIIDNF